MSSGAREYARAEGRLKESIALRREGLRHDYPRRREDLDTMRRYHAEHGTPSSAATLWGLASLLWGSLLAKLEGGGEPY